VQGIDFTLVITLPELKKKKKNYISPRIEITADNNIVKQSPDYVRPRIEITPDINIVHVGPLG
jgi:hypothetical protein